MAAVVGKTIFSDGKGKLFFGYYKDNDAVEFVDYKTWKKLSFKDVSKGDTNKERVIKAILKNQKQFNKKVDFNMWAKKQKRSFEDTMDWFIQNGWINNINKGGIKESIDVLSVNEAVKPSQVRSAISKVKKGLMRKWKQKGGYENFGQKELSQMRDKFDYNPYGSSDERQISKMLDGFNDWAMNYDGNMRESVNESASKEAMGIAGFTGTRGSAVEDFITKNELDGKKLFQYVKKGGLKQRMDFVTAIAGNPGNKIQKMIISKFKLGESVNEVNLKPKKLNKLKKGEKFVFNNTPYEFIELYSDIPNAAKVKKEDGKTSVVSFGGGVVNKNTKGGFSDYLKQGGRVWDHVNMDGESVNEITIPQLAKKDAEHLDRHVGGKSEREVKAFVDKVYSFYPKDVRKYMSDAFLDYQKNNRTLKYLTTALRVMHQDIRESVNEAKFGYKDSTASYINNHKDEYKVAEKMNKGNEMKFYDALEQMEVKLGHPKTMLFISNALRGYGVDMYKDPKIKNPADAQEALFLLSK